MLSIEQIRAARALLDWSQSDLAEKAGLSQTGIARIENGTNQPNTKTLQKIETAFDDANIEFMGTTGLRKKTRDIKILKGRTGFISFMNDVYHSVKEVGGEICVYNVDESNWLKWMGQDEYNAHAERMRKIEKPLKAKIIVKEGDDLFIADDFAEYKWMSKELFNTQSFYAYDSKLAFIHFKDDDVQVMILNQDEFTKGFKVLFDTTWQYAAKEAR